MTCDHFKAIKKYSPILNTLITHGNCNIFLKTVYQFLIIINELSNGTASEYYILKAWKL